MRITFVGTSHGVPSAERYCTCIIIHSGKSFYFIDAGAPVADVIQRQGLDMRNFKGIFTTHVHGDHTAGLFQVADLLNWYYRDCSADFFVTDPEQAEAIEKLIYISNNKTGVDKERVRFKTATDGVVYEDENIKVEYIPNRHISSSPSYSILVSEGEKRVLFAGDLSGHLAANDVPVETLESGVDAFVCELAHFTLDELSPYLDGAKTDKLFFTHVYPIEKYGEIEKIKGKYPFEVLTPRDNDSYEI
ncbi:MAG: MBL fold metallo-hydrolase [Clostridia bacterium]|nr:MBL fold metallo-hydrolase [Clostridia bacterium]